MAHTPGFVYAEAEELLALCCNINANPISNTSGTLVPPPANAPTPPPVPPIPAGWELKWTATGPDGKPGVVGLDNYFEIYENSEKNQYAIVFRGTEDNLDSILEDLALTMIPATGSVTIGGKTTKYQLAADSRAGVHAGFAYGVASTLVQIGTDLVLHPGSDVFITGHSQGAALATLARSAFEYTDLSWENQHLKTYVFAQPKPGNDYYALDFDRLSGADGMAVRVSNDQDWVPQAAITIQQETDVNTPNPVDLLVKKFPELGTVIQDVQGAEQALVNKINALAEAALKAKLGSDVTLPGFLPTLDFTSCGAQVVLKGVPATPEQAVDFMWEHHATMYYKLLTEQLAPS